MAEMTIDKAFDAAARWRHEALALRDILLGAGLEEQVKWNKPCYSAAGGNIVIIQRMKPFLALMFFKGALLKDPERLLQDQGPNSRSAKRLEFTTVDDILHQAAAIEALIAAAIEVEKAGLTVQRADPSQAALPAELDQAIAADPALGDAFRALTPGRQRGYLLHFTTARQSATRAARIEKCRQHILAGKGFHDR